MITTINEYEAETAFERLALDRYLPLTAQTSGSYIDIRPLIDGGKNVIKNGTSHIQANREDSLRAAFLPLAFGAAWKVLDLTLELALAKQGIKPQQWVAPFTIVHEQMRCRGRVGHLDARIDLPVESGCQLVGQCEDLPDKDVIIDLMNPPSYLAYR